MTLLASLNTLADIVVHSLVIVPIAGALGLTVLIAVGTLRRDDRLQPQRFSADKHEEFGSSCLLHLVATESVFDAVAAQAVNAGPDADDRHAA